MNNVETINNSGDTDAVEAIRNLTNGRGADVCVDAVGMEAERTFFEKVKTAVNFEVGTSKVMELCFRAVRRGGIVTEGAGEWGRVLQDLKKRGVEDVLFFCVDGLAGFGEAISEAFPRSFVQRCIVHMVRSSTRFVADKDTKAVCAALRRIYTAADEQQAGAALDALREEWEKEYPEVAKAWERDWMELTPFLDFGGHTRRMIYTTNAVEALHRQLRKVTKSKGSWVNDRALLKQIYLILAYGRGGWDRKVFNWNAISRELCERFAERFTKHL